MSHSTRGWIELVPWVQVSWSCLNVVPCNSLFHQAYFIPSVIVKRIVTRLVVAKTARMAADPEG